jgi:glutamate N-acetyltransferase/amino-acid N-acetyltransferase
VTKLATVAVAGARKTPTPTAWRSVANSALVKTLFGGDLNWGRIVQAIAPQASRCGRRGRRAHRRRRDAARRRAPRAASRPAPRGAPAKKKEVPIEISLGRGPGRARMLTTDFSYEYVRVNAEYTT